jgi:hypothetical protein
MDESRGAGSADDGLHDASAEPELFCDRSDIFSLLGAENRVEHTPRSVAFGWQKCRSKDVVVHVYSFYYAAIMRRK